MRRANCWTRPLTGFTIAGTVRIGRSHPAGEPQRVIIPLSQIPAPFTSSPVAIDRSWLDPNGHVNMAYFMVISERGLDQAWTAMGIGWEYARETGLSTFAAEVHTRYLRELMGNDTPTVTFHALEVDDKRLHGVSEIRNPAEGTVAATTEQLWLHVDLSTRRVTPWPGDVRERLEAWVAAHRVLGPVDWAGRGVKMPRR